MTWSAAAGMGGKSYNLGTYRTEEEVTRAKVARTVVTLLLRQGVPLPTS
jgi:hypothetical protein